MKRRRINRIVPGLCILAAVLLGGCGQTSENTVTIIDGDFAEMQIFTQIARIMIEENTDINVRVQDSVASGLAFQQIKDGKNDIYMCYDGSLLTAYLGRDSSEVPEGMTVYEYANRLGQETANVMLTPKLGSQNTYVAAVRRETAEKYGLKCVSDLKKCDSELTFAAEHEFFDEGSKHYDAFAKEYGLDFKESNTIDRGLKYVAMNYENMDVTIVYSTDGLNKKFDLVKLADDRKFFPEYNGAYLIRADLYEDYPELKQIFQSLEGKFTDEICTGLNYKIDVKDEDPYEIAYEFLKEQGLIK